MDLIAACRVLVEVDERGSVTRAAAAIGVAQSVASRRLSALEARLGGPLLERSAQRAVLTPFGRGIVTSARRLVRLADEFELDAERALLRPVAIAVPETCSTRDLAVAVAAGRSAGFNIDFQSATPGRRVELAASLAVRIALVAVPASEGRWVVPLGAAGRQRHAGSLRLDALKAARQARPGRDADAGSRLRIGPEDNVPHIRDVVTREGFAAGLLPGQLPVDSTTADALASVLSDGDLLLCSETEARNLGLFWRPLTGIALARGYSLTGSSEHDEQRVANLIADELSTALGADPGGGAEEEAPDA